MYKIFIVEDDVVIAEGISKGLKNWGYEAVCTNDFANVKNEFVKEAPHLVLMDITLPFYNGYHWCEEIRKISKVPVIFISSASEDMNVIMAVNMGGDDFISKPFDINLLLAKIQAMLRRTYEFGKNSNLMEHKGVILDMGNATLTYDSKPIELTKNEYKILQVLMENKGKCVSRDDIIVKLWESDDYIDDNTLTVNVTRIRKKLENAGLMDFIHTKKGMGYYIDD